MTIEQVNELIASGQLNEFIKLYEDYGARYEFHIRSFDVPQPRFPVSYVNGVVSLPFYDLKYSMLDVTVGFGVHELGHYIVSSPEQRELDNYGLEYMFPQESFVEEVLTGTITKMMLQIYIPTTQKLKNLNPTFNNIVDKYDDLNLNVGNNWPSSKKLTVEEKQLVTQTFVELQNKWYHKVGLKENNEFVYGKRNMTTQETKKELVSLVKSFIVS